MDQLNLLIEVAVEPKTKADQANMGFALNRLAQEDPTFRVTSDCASNQTIIKGMSEQHLEALVDRLSQEFKVEINVGAPQVAYRETITHRVEIDYTHEKQTGGSSQFARVKFVFEPSEPGEGIVFECKMVAGSVPKEFIAGVEKGIVTSAETGVLVGFPMIDIKATLIDGTSRENGSSIRAFEVASRAAFREGVAKAAPKLLEPIMRVEIVTPEDCEGDITGDMNRRRGSVTSMDTQANTRVISGLVPLSNMFGYVNNLRAISQGRAKFTMFFDHYALVPDWGPDPDPSSPAIAKRA